MRIKVEKKKKKRKNRVKNKSVVRFLLVPIIFGRNLTHVKYLYKISRYTILFQSIQTFRYDNLHEFKRDYKTKIIIK